MSLKETLETTKDYFEGIERSRKFKRANKDRNEAVELQKTTMECRAKLELCKNDFLEAIQDQSEHILKGRELHTDTVVQEQILWDSAIGYMLVNDAIYALKTVKNYDTVSHAYEMLDAALRQISGKKESKLGGFLNRHGSERNEYGYIKSQTAVKEKEGLLNSIFEELILSRGKIDECLENAQNEKKVTPTSTPTPNRESMPKINPEDIITDPRY